MLPVDPTWRDIPGGAVWGGVVAGDDVGRHALRPGGENAEGGGGSGGGQRAGGHPRGAGGPTAESRDAGGDGQGEGAGGAAAGGGGGRDRCVCLAPARWGRRAAATTRTGRP